MPDHSKSLVVLSVSILLVACPQESTDSDDVGDSDTETDDSSTSSGTDDDITTDGSTTDDDTTTDDTTTDDTTTDDTTTTDDDTTDDDTTDDGDPVCGDGIVEGDEECDDGNMVDVDECTNGCTLACGDGIVQMWEACDDGPSNGADAPCTPECSAAACGDGYVHAMGGEQCDDGNVAGNDGCSSTCTPQVVLQYSGGQHHGCALLQGGTVRCWGHGYLGLLGYATGNFGDIDVGDGEFPNSAGDVDVGGTVVQLSAGGEHTCALLDDGSVRCWGRASLGQLGYGNTIVIGDDETPASAGDVPLGGTAVQVNAGEEHTCAVMSTGAVRCWGHGQSAKLGYATGGGVADNIGDNETPASAGDVDVGGLATKVVAGDLHTCALLENGAVRCWGSNGSGQLGYGGGVIIIGDDETPASVGDVDLGGPAIDIDVGGSHSCAILQGGEVKCWGLGWLLGYGDSNNIGDDETPADVGFVDVGGAATKIALGNTFSCVLLDTGDVRCWGRGDEGHLGYGNTIHIGDDELPSSVGPVGLGGTVTDFGVGWYHTCAIVEGGGVRCWGFGGNGRLGYANVDDIGDDELPSSVGPVQIF